MQLINSLRDAQPCSVQSVERTSFIFLDIETTGLYPNRGARITEIAILNRNSTTFAWKGDKDKLSDKKLAEQLPVVLRHLTTGVVVGHNISFDLGFLAYEADRLRFRGPKVLFVDTLGLAKKLCDNLKDYKLATLLENFEISTDGPLHTAIVDAQVTRALFWKLVNTGDVETLKEAGMQQLSWTTF